MAVIRVGICDVCKTQFNLENGILLIVNGDRHSRSFYTTHGVDGDEAGMHCCGLSCTLQHIKKDLDDMIKPKAKGEHVELKEVEGAKVDAVI